MKKASNVIFYAIVAGLVIFILGKYFYMQPKFIHGEALPEFTAQTLHGKTLNLSDLRGKYVLVDFWGSWCGPCRQENPQLVRLYQKYHQAGFTDAAGFEIVSVGIEKDKGRWRRAIEQDGLIWPNHVLDQATSLRFFDSPIAAEFGVKQLPSKYLINGEGVIIGVNQPVEQLDDFLMSKLTK